MAEISHIKTPDGVTYDIKVPNQLSFKDGSDNTLDTYDGSLPRALKAGTNVTMSSSGGVTTISATASGGTANYNELSNKPQIEGTTLTGDKSLSDLGIMAATVTHLSGDVEANSSITGATKCKITYDQKGLVTSGADLGSSDIPSLDASKITSGTFADARIASAATWNAKADDSEVVKLTGTQNIYGTKTFPHADYASSYVSIRDGLTGQKAVDLANCNVIAGPSTVLQGNCFSNACFPNALFETLTLPASSSRVTFSTGSTSCPVSGWIRWDGTSQGNGTYFGVKVYSAEDSSLVVYQARVTFAGTNHTDAFTFPISKGATVKVEYGDYITTSIFQLFDTVTE